MNQSEERQIGALISSNRLVAILALIASLAIIFAGVILRERYVEIHRDTGTAVQEVRDLAPRVERLEADFAKLSQRIERRLETVENGINEIRLWVAEQRGRELRGGN